MLYIPTFIIEPLCFNWKYSEWYVCVINVNVRKMLENRVRYKLWNVYKKPTKSCDLRVLGGTPSGTRTLDTLIKSQLKI